MGIKHHLLRLARIGTHEQHPAPGKPDVSDLTIIITPLSRTTSRRRSWRVAFAPQPAQASVQTHHGAAQFLAAAGGVMFVRQAAGDVHYAAERKDVKVALTFDFDACCVRIGTLGAKSPSMISRGEFGPIALRRILDLLDRFGVKSTFFIPGHSAVAFPEPTRMIRAGGHEIGHHGWVHENPAMLTPEQERHVLERGLEALDRIAGVRPVGYRSPAWDNSPVTVSLLLEYGFEYESSLMGGDYAPYWCRVGDALFLARDRHNQVSVGSLGNFRGARQEGAPTYRGNKTRTCRSAPLTGQRR